jgi:hypothetical protein
MDTTTVSKEMQVKMIEGEKQAYLNTIGLLTIRYRVAKRLDDKEAMTNCETEMGKCETALDELDKMLVELDQTKQA